MTKTNNLKGLFVTEANQNAGAKANQLSKTAQLTNLSTEIAREVLKATETDLEKYQEMILESQKSHDAMDNLINDCYNLNDVDIEFLKTEDEDTLDRMIKSQQSKRSRAKSKEMTIENYLTMMTGAVAENLLRIAANKPKQTGGGGRRARIRYTDEELEELAKDPEALTRAIRNVQSKKSIYKSKTEFDPESDRWKELLEVEEELKAIRDGRSIEAEKAVEKTSQLEEMLATVDPKDLKAADAKQMLDSIKEMLATK